MTQIKEKFKDIIIKITKNNCESWLSFLSGIFSNIPITLLLMLSKPTDNWMYWLIYVLSIFLSIVLVVLSIILTIMIINIKDIAKERYNQYIAEKKSIAPIKYAFYLKEECDRKAKSIILSSIASIICFILLVVLIITLWFLI